MDVAELNELYRQAESVDREVFAEMRSNILLVAGDHYQKRADRYFSQIRDNRDISDHQKLRLTKNHVQKITRHYETHLMEYASGVAVLPQREAELQDQKSAELNSAVWQDAQGRWRIHDLKREWISDFVRIGEAAICIKWDDSAGDLVGYEPLVDDYGMPAMDEMGNPIPDKEKPVFSGGFEFKRLYAFNLLRSSSAKNMRESPFLINRELVPHKEAMRQFKGQPEKQKMLVADKGDDFIIFDAVKGGYDRATNQVMFKEYFFKPSEEYPQGKYFLTTSSGILEESELPFGIWPIVWAGFDEHATAARARSIVKQARPYQAEINRASSAVAMHQITIGDDKVLYQTGTKLSPGTLLPGVRGIAYQGAKPEVLPGRDGSQYAKYIDMQIAELYNVTDVFEIGEEKNQQFDPLALLYRSGKQRQKFFYYTYKFERFMCDVCELFLKLAREYYDDDMTITAIGRNEIINIEEFKNTEPLNYRVTIEPQDETLETKFGKQVSMMHVLQYAGNQLTKEDIGMFARNMPFANNEEMFKDFTLSYDTAKNTMLALERGEMPDIDAEDDPGYMIAKLTNRMRQADFKFLHPSIQQAYQQTRYQYHTLQAQKLAKAQQAKNEFIPADGPMIACDMYVEAGDPNKAPKRARIPQNALNWLLKQLQFQQGPVDELERMSGGSQGEIADILAQQRAQGGMAGQPMPPNAPPPGQATALSPLGGI